MGYKKQLFLDPSHCSFLCIKCSDVVIDPVTKSCCHQLLCNTCFDYDNNKCGNQSCRGKRFKIQHLPGHKYQEYLSLRMKCPEVDCQQNVTIKTLGNHQEECRSNGRQSTNDGSQSTNDGSQSINWKYQFDELSQLFDDLNESYKHLSDMNEMLKKENEMLKKENEMVKKENEVVKKENEMVKKENEGLRMKVSRQQSDRQFIGRQQYQRQWQNQQWQENQSHQRQGKIGHQANEDGRRRGQRSASVDPRDQSVCSNRRRRVTMDEGKSDLVFDEGKSDLVFDEAKTSAKFIVRKHLEIALKECYQKGLTQRLLFDRLNRIMNHKLGGRWFSFDAQVYDPLRSAPKSGTECHYNFYGTDHVTYEGI